MMSLLLTLIFIPIVLVFSKHYNIVDVPNERKIHSGHTPRLGGLGIYLSFLLCFYFLGEFNSITIGIVFGSTIIVIVGVCDDVFHLRPRYKLLAQLIAATIVIFYSDVIFRFDAPLFVEIILSYLWIVGVTNAVNLVDGMDGLASGLSLIGLVAIGAAANLAGNVYFATLSFVIVGSILGFLRFNLPPAKIFMGDTGSLFLGFMVSVLSLIISYKSATLLAVIVPIMFVSIPVFDTFLAILRRVKGGRHPFAPDKEHLHHRLLELNFTHKQTLLIFYSFSSLLGITAVLFNNRQVVYGLIIIMLALYVFLVILKMGHFYNVGGVIERVNRRLRFIKRSQMTAKHETVYTSLLNPLISVVTYLFIIMAIYFKTSWSYTEVASILALALVILASNFAAEFFKISNAFICFLLFWFFYYVNLTVIDNGLLSSFYYVYLILIFLTVLKVILKKRVDFLFVNPMEVLAIYGLFLINIMNNLGIHDNILVLFLTTVLYYPNKAIMSKKHGIYKYHVAFILILIVFMPYNFYNSLYSETFGNIQLSAGSTYASPYAYKKLADKFIQGEKYEAARRVVLKYHDKTNLKILHNLIHEESAEVYAKLVVGEMKKGHLDKSNEYLAEYLTMYPEAVDYLYGNLKPFFKGISETSLTGGKHIKLVGIPTGKIISAYSDTIMKVALSQINRGYISNGEECFKVATLLNKLALKQKTK